MNEKIGVIGLGYVGLPVALAFAKRFPGTVGFDINSRKVAALKDGVDTTGEVSTPDLRSSSLQITDRKDDLRSCTFFVVAVPTPIDQAKRPDLSPLDSASRLVGEVLKAGDVVVYESTVYPGVTEEYCAPILAQVSGLKRSAFKVGYSPERINPGDKTRTIEKIVKVVSGEDKETLDRVAGAYAAIVDAGVHKATTIKVAEAAKVIENTQRDLNIALMNELALVFDRLGINTIDVLEAAGTKWNFLPFRPGLVGGHCIGVDPYYLTAKAEEIGYHPQVILAGRRINDGMGQFIAQKAIKLMVSRQIPLASARVGVFGLTFKEDVPDIRNSRIPDIIGELREYRIDPLVFDPIADKEETHEEYGLHLAEASHAKNLDCAILAVSHEQYRRGLSDILASVKPGGVIIDVKGVTRGVRIPDSLGYWCL